ncbi:translation factor GTPase family protein [Cohnella sp. REN36]|uniref:elongation factor G n=1 Tax=Cohnella sp. REN36 TaxID=2887347 RepID=UPI001D140DF1|nr:TetM/TetW/TetO/TetS family tetracycline resistance ribosomal protection protein [Cohnella sp. REN36]MCC3372397.1 TetM/TetW/TetO/TetS family tetracycline resistance ribosomal protection protein [Cohnella sp. REN36]
MNTINIGVLAHVDAGKTTLTEHILHEANIVGQPGSVDKGDTLTDSMELERKRGITIKASAVSFMLGDLKVNVLDTPGHADFISEVERSVRVLDGAILVVSAVEGVQAQTKVLMKSLMKLRIPTIIFVNKIDRSGADSGKVIRTIREKLTDKVIPLYRGSREGTNDADIDDCDWQGDRDGGDFVESCMETLALQDERLLDEYVNGRTFAQEDLVGEIATQARRADVYPLFLGAAAKGIGVKELIRGIEQFLPSNAGAGSCTGAGLSGVVFKIEREAVGEKKAYVRLFSGAIRLREEVRIWNGSGADQGEFGKGKIKKLSALVNGKQVAADRIEAGDIGIVHGLQELRIGDVLGEWNDRMRTVELEEPNLEAVIQPWYSGDVHRLYQALIDMADEDPLIWISRDPQSQEIYIRLFGEVQKEVIQAVLLEKYGIAAEFSKTSVICIEKPKGCGAARAVISEDGNLFNGTVGFRVEPGAENSGMVYGLGVELGSLPLPFHHAIEESVLETLKQGLYGWRVTDIKVTLTDSGYSSPVSTAADFRKLTPLVLMEALSRAGTDVYEPMNGFEFTLPASGLGTALFQLSKVKAELYDPMLSKEEYLLTGAIPARVTEPFKAKVQSYTEGEGMFISKPVGYRKVTDEVPTRKRSDYNPLNKKEYLMHIMGTVRKRV